MCIRTQYRPGHYSYINSIQAGPLYVYKLNTGRPLHAHRLITRPLHTYKLNTGLPLYVHRLNTGSLHEYILNTGELYVYRLNTGGPLHVYRFIHILLLIMLANLCNVNGAILLSKQILGLLEFFLLL